MNEKGKIGESRISKGEDQEKGDGECCTPENSSTYDLGDLSGIF